MAGIGHLQRRICVQAKKPGAGRAPPELAAVAMMLQVPSVVAAGSLAAGLASSALCAMGVAGRVRVPLRPWLPVHK